MEWGIVWDYMARAASYAQLGRMEEAQEEIAQMLAVDPNFARDIWEQFRKFNFPDENIEAYIDGLRKAGLDIPEEQDLTH